MKKILTLVAAIATLVCTFPANAQNDNDKQNSRQEWKERVMSEKIAFITTKLSLTPESAQTFWPVYNQVSKKKDQAYFELRKSYKAMEAAQKAGDEKEIGKALDSYVKALNATRSIEAESLESYRKVLTNSQIATLYQAEEQFRYQQINRLHQKPGNPHDGNPDHSHQPKPSGQHPEKR